MHELFENIELLEFLLVNIAVPDNELEISAGISVPFIEKKPVHIKTSKQSTQVNRFFSRKQRQYYDAMIT